MAVSEHEGPAGAGEARPSKGSPVRKDRPGDDNLGGFRHRLETGEERAHVDFRGQGAFAQELPFQACRPVPQDGRERGRPLTRQQNQSSGQVQFHSPSRQRAAALVGHLAGESEGLSQLEHRPRRLECQGESWGEQVADFVLGQGPVIDFDLGNGADKTLADSELTGLEGRRSGPGSVGLCAIQPQVEAGVVSDGDDLVPFAEFRDSGLHARFRVAVQEGEKGEPASLRRIVQAQEIAIRQFEDVLVSVGLVIGRTDQCLDGDGSLEPPGLVERHLDIRTPVEPQRPS